MISPTEIQAVCDTIVREFAPEQVILFGSYAYGTPTEHSDVDLLVVMPIPEAERHRQEKEIQKRIPHQFRMHLLVKSPEEITTRVAQNDWFLREILEKGNVLYGSEGFCQNTLAKTYNWRGKKGMNLLTEEWVRNAEEDYAMAKRAQVPTPYPNSICFHAQQCIEKYLKAWFQEMNIPVPRTHDLQELLHLSLPTRPAWQTWQTTFSEFRTFAVDARYPGYTATAEEAQQVLQICTDVRHAVRLALRVSVAAEPQS